MPRRKTKAILIIEDNALSTGHIQKIIKKNKFVGITCTSAIEALLTVKSLIPHLIITDFNVRKYSDGVDLATAIRQSTKHDIPVIIISNKLDHEHKARDKGFEFILKPFKQTEMESVIKKCLRSTNRQGINVKSNRYEMA